MSGFVTLITPLQIFPKPGKQLRPESRSSHFQGEVRDDIVKILSRGKCQMRRVALLLCSLLLAGAAKADGEQAGGFDYYVMSLSWSPNWCSLTGDSRGDPQCDKGRGLTFILHGLWPQFDRGGPPSACRTGATDPSRTDTAAMADIMGGAGLAWHEWKEHGRCTGLSSDAYLAAMRKAYGLVKVPPLFAKVTHDLRLAPKVVEDAFLESNPDLSASEVVVTCNQGLIQEVRICLTKTLSPRPCGQDVKACPLPTASLDAVR
jgi:ribonuclease T2